MLCRGPGLPCPKVEAAGPFHTGRSVQPRPGPSFVELKQPETPGAGLPRPNWSREPSVQGYLPLRKAGLPRPFGKDSKADAHSSQLVPVDPPAFVFGGGAVTFQVQPGLRAKEFEDTQWRSLAETWVGYLQRFFSSSHFFKDLGELAVDSLWKILHGKAAGTLRRLLPGLKLWLDFHPWE